MLKQLYYNTGKLLLSIFSRDYIPIIIWVSSITIFSILIGNMLPNLYATGLDREIMAETMKNPAITAMLGPGYGLDNYTDGAMMAHFMLLFTAVVLGIMGILLVTRHTREEEEEGRTEIIRSLPVGFLSNLSATIISVSLVCITIAFLLSIGLSILGLEDMDFQNSLLYGAALGGTGIFFATLTGLFAQLTTNARSTIGLSFTFLIASYIIRAIGDTGREWVAMLSPFGWILRTEVFVNNYWWPIFLTLGASAIIFSISLILNNIRDIGTGFIPTKPGPKKASAFLQTPLALALRLQRTAILSWIIGMFILGISYGSILGDLEAFINTSGMIKEMLPQVEGFTLTEQFLTMLTAIISILGSIPVLMFLLKLRGEEKKHRLEHLLIRSVSRTKIMLSYTGIAMIAAPIMQMMSILGLWSASSMVMDNPISFEVFFKAAFTYVPAMWVMVGLGAILIGFIPRLTSLTWVYLGYAFFVVYLGDLLDVPKAMAKLSPFGNVPQIPIEDMSYTNISVLTILSILLIIAGIVAFNKRDIEG